MGFLATRLHVWLRHTKPYLLGIVITIVVVLTAGFIVGKILPLLGRRTEVYEDAEEFLDAEA